MDIVEKDGTPSALGVNAFTPVQEIKSPEAFPLTEMTEGSEAGKLCAAAQAAQKSAQSGALSSTLGSQGCAELDTFCKQVLSSGESLQRVATVGSSRWVLRGDTDSTQGVCIALDEDVQFSKGPGGPAAAAAIDAIDFPYCLMEVAGEGGSKKWLEELQGDAALRCVPDFSVGAHAVAALNKDAVGQLPPWYESLERLETQAPPEGWGIVLQWRDAMKETAEEAQAMSAAPVPSASTQAVTVPPPLVPAAAPAAVAVEAPSDEQEFKCLEPKNLLASERTMLEWMHTVFALAMVGIGLWRFSMEGKMHKTGSVTGFVNTHTRASTALGVYSLFLVAVAVAFAWYAVLTHLNRLKALINGEITERIFNKRVGPVLFGLSVGLALVAHLAVQVMA